MTLNAKEDYYSFVFDLSEILKEKDHFHANNRLNQLSYSKYRSDARCAGIIQSIKEKIETEKILVDMAMSCSNNYDPNHLAKKRFS